MGLTKVRPYLFLMLINLIGPILTVPNRTVIPSKLVRVVFVYRPKGRYETGMIKLVYCVLVYRPKGRYETGMFKVVRVVLLYRPK